MPAAAVIRRVQALIGFTGRKERVGGLISQLLKPRAHPWGATETVRLEGIRGKRNSMSSGEMRRYMEEHRWRKRFSSILLTLRRESMGSKQD